MRKYHRKWRKNTPYIINTLKNSKRQANKVEYEDGI